MSFLWPVMLVLLVLVPLGVVVYLWMQQRRRRVIAGYGNLGLLQGAIGHRLGFRRHIAPAFFLLALTVLIIAVARPQTVISVPRIEGTVILAFDVSGSMAADDLKPTRMEAAKAAAKDFVQRQPLTVQIGVVSFSDSGNAVQAPTNDQHAILDAIDRLTPQRGTSLAQGIQASFNAIATGTGQTPPLGGGNVAPTPGPTPTPVPKGSYTSAVIVLLTDGENNESPDPLTVAQTAADHGIRINTIGIGSAAGATLHVNGFTVHTALDEEMLQQIALIGNGTYYNAANEQDLHNIYDNLDPQLVIKPEKTEVTAVFAGASVLLLLIGGLVSLMWFGRLP